MENLIARIVDTEKQCAQAISQAEADSRETQAAHARTLEERKILEFAAIAAAAGERFTRSIEEARKKIEAESASLRNNNERIEHDTALNETIKQKILSLLLRHEASA